MIDNIGDMEDSDLEPSNVDIEIDDQSNEWVHGEKMEEGDDTKIVLAQEIEPTDPSAQE
jgi:hypothetical protein